MGSCPDTDIDPDFFPLLLHLFTDFYDSFTEVVFIFCVRGCLLCILFGLCVRNWHVHGKN